MLEGADVEGSDATSSGMRGEATAAALPALVWALAGVLSPRLFILSNDGCRSDHCPWQAQQLDGRLHRARRLRR